MFKKYTKGKVAVFIDAATLLYSQQTLGWRIDYQKLRDYLKNQAKISGLFYYTGKVGAFEKQIKFIKKLERLGFLVVSKEVKFIKMDDGKLLPKGNLDVELALDAFRLLGGGVTLFFFSGDSDFGYLLDLLKHRGKRVLVVSTRGHISKELLERAKYIDLRKLKKEIIFNKNQEPSEDDP